MSSSYNLTIHLQLVGWEAVQSQLKALNEVLKKVVDPQKNVRVEITKASGSLDKYLGSIDKVSKELSHMNSAGQKVSNSIKKVNATFTESSETAQSLQEATRKVSVTFGEGGEMAVYASGRLTSFADSLDTLNQAMGKVYAYATRMSIITYVIAMTLRQVRRSTLNVAKAQDRYNDTVAKFGPNSIQAARALRDLNKAQADQHAFMIQARIQAVLFGLSLASLVTDVTKAAVTIFTQYIPALQAENVATAEGVALLAAKNSLLTFGIGVAIAAGSALLFMKFVQDQVNKTVEEFGETTGTAGEKIKPMYESWADVVDRIAGETRVNLVGRTQKYIQQFIESVVNPNEEMVRYITKAYYDTSKELTRRTAQKNKEIAMLNNAGRVKEAQELAKERDTYIKNTQKRLDTLKELHKLYWDAMVNGTQVSMQDVLRVLGEATGSAKGEFELWSDAIKNNEDFMNSLLETYGDFDTFITENAPHWIENAERLRDVWKEVLDNMNNALGKGRGVSGGTVSGGGVPTGPPVLPPVGWITGNEQFGGLISRTGFYKMEAGEYVIPRNYSIGVNASEPSLTVYIGEMRFEGRPLNEGDAKIHAAKLWREIKAIMEKENRLKFRTLEVRG